VAKDLLELQNRVEEINLWLNTVGDRAMRNDQSVNWLKRLKDAAYDAEDLVHEFHIEAEKQDLNVGGKKNVVVILVEKTQICCVRIQDSSQDQGNKEEI